MIEIEDLEELFDDLPIDEPTPEQVFTMYGIFLTDFVKKPLTIKGRRVKINTNPSKHPLFKNKNETFVHVITRDSKIAGRRNFDRERANRIHWIRPILEQVDNPAIWYFERLNDRQQMQYFYWYEAGNFLVLLRNIEPDLFLVTSFYVDKGYKTQFKEWYKDYKGL